MPTKLDRLTSQMYHLPTIIGRLGISIAEAQKELNADYLRSLKQLARLIEHAMKVTPPNEVELAEGEESSLQAFGALLKSLAPSRYQFTETTVDFSADLSEHFSVGVQAGGSAGIGAVMINAAMSMGMGRDYRAAARVKTVLQAYQGEEIVRQLLDRARELDAEKVPIPERTAADEEIWKTTSEIRNALMPSTPLVTTPPKLDTEPEHAPTRD